MSIRPLTALAILLGAGYTIVGLNASTPAFWQVSTQADFLQGEVEHLSIDGEGRLLLGPASELVEETSSPFLWTLLPLPDGHLLAGSGNEGRVYRLAADGSGEAEVYFDAQELEIHALAVTPDGSVYAGSSPDGKVYKVAPDGSADVFFDPETKYIWAMAFDPKGNLYVATGDQGVIYKVAPDGTGTPFYTTKSTHVTTLAFDSEGQLLAGTESPGRVYRIDASGKAFVLLDSSFQEIHSLRVDENGTIWAAAVSGRPGTADRPAESSVTPPARVAPVPSVSTEITTMTIVGVSEGGASASTRSESSGAPKGAVYRIAPDGLWDVVWESTEDAPYDIAIEAGGSLLIGTGNDGKIYRVSGDPIRTTLATRAGAQQITSFLQSMGRTFYATANPGKVFSLSPRRAESGTYVSTVRDATTVASWGSMRWRATTTADSSIAFFSRSGNTATPDNTWSEWAGPYTNPDGSQITSPKARYLQWRAVLTAKSGAPVLTSVTVAYLERNLRPSVTSITVHPPGTVFQKPFSGGEPEIAGYESNISDGRATISSNAANPGSGQSTRPTLGRRIYQKGLQTFVWDAEDDNDDSLQFNVFYRGEEDAEWTMLREDLWDPIFAWDTSSVPDGSYLIKIAASDAPSNSPGAALAGELESSAFDVDNTPPRIEAREFIQEDDRTLVKLTVRDAHSSIQRVEYSLDANSWRVIYPNDGIPDSRIEEFEIHLEGGSPINRVIIRATDAMSNAATAVATRQISESP